MMHFHFGSDLHLRRPATGRNEAKDAINKNAPILMLSLKGREEKIPAQRRRLDVVARSNDNIKDLTTILFHFRIKYAGNLFLKILGRRQVMDATSSEDQSE